MFTIWNLSETIRYTKLCVTHKPDVLSVYTADMLFSLIFLINNADVCLLTKSMHFKLKTGIYTKQIHRFQCVHDICDQ